MWRILVSCYSSLLEMIVVDLAFACFYNLVTDYSTSQPTVHYVGKMLSSVFISVLILHYLNILEVALYSPHKLADFQHQLVTDSFEKQALKKSLNVRSINILFRLKIVALMASIIMLQNQIYLCIVTMIVIQVGCMFQIFYCIVKFKKVFSSKLGFCAHFFIEMSILTLLLICILVYNPKEDLQQYELEGKKVTESSYENVFNFILIAFICLSILTELLNVVIEGYLAIKEKCRKKDSRELKLNVGRTQQQIIEGYWGGAKVLYKVRAVKQVRKKRSSRRMMEDKINLKRSKIIMKIDPVDFPTDSVDKTKFNNGSSSKGGSRRMVTFSSDKNIMKNSNRKIAVSRKRKSGFKLKIGKKQKYQVQQRAKKRKTYLMIHSQNQQLDLDESFNNSSKNSEKKSLQRYRKSSFNKSEIGSVKSKKTLKFRNKGKVNLPKALDKVKQRFLNIRSRSNDLNNASPEKILKKSSFEFANASSGDNPVARVPNRKGSRSPKKKVTIADRLNQFHQRSSSFGVDKRGEAKKRSVSPQKSKSGQRKSKFNPKNFPRSMTTKNKSSTNEVPSRFGTPDMTGKATKNNLFINSPQFNSDKSINLNSSMHSAFQERGDRVSIASPARSAKLAKVKRSKFQKAATSNFKVQHNKKKLNLVAKLQEMSIGTPRLSLGPNIGGLNLPDTPNYRKGSQQISNFNDEDALEIEDVSSGSKSDFNKDGPLNTSMGYEDSFEG